MADFTLWPKNDFAKFVKGKQINSATGAVSDQVNGTVTAFFATSGAPGATEAHADLKVEDCPFVEGKGFLIFFDRTKLDFTVLDDLFASVAPVLIVDDGEGWRVTFAGEYLASRPGTVKA